MAGAISQAAFCLSYVWLGGRRPWGAAIAAGCGGFAVATAVLIPLALPLPALAAVVVAALALAVRLMPPDRWQSRVTTPPPRFHLAARVVVATALVLVLTGVAEALGPRLTGLLAPFPLYAAVLAGFAHALDGAAAAASVLRGLLLGLFAFAAFFLVLAASLEVAGMAAAFAMAVAVAAVLHGVSLWALRRLR